MKIFGAQVTPNKKAGWGEKMKHVAGDKDTLVLHFPHTLNSLSQGQSNVTS